MWYQPLKSTGPKVNVWAVFQVFTLAGAMGWMRSPTGRSLYTQEVAGEHVRMRRVEEVGEWWIAVLLSGVPEANQPIPAVRPSWKQQSVYTP